MGKLKINKSYIICIVLALLTSIGGNGLFTFPATDDSHFAMAVFDFTICKIIAFIVLFLLYRCIYILGFSKNDDTVSNARTKIIGVIKAAAPYLVVVLGALIIKLPAGYISNDENAIYSNAIGLVHDTWFNYLTTYYYIVSLMLIPFKYGPIIVKAIIQVLTVGYVVYRMQCYFGKLRGMWGYALFLLYPVIAYTTSAHRLPIYFLVYLILMSKLLFDKLENESIDVLGAFVIILTGAALTQWRTEGIYLAVLIPILCFLVYPTLRNKKNAIIFLIAFLAVQYLISIPQNGLNANNLDDAANDRMKPFYAYTITNMYRNGLDFEKNAEDLAIVDKYLSLEMVAAINEHYGDINYEDVLILYQDGFVGVREEATVEDFINYSDALKRIFVNNPDVFVRTRIGAFLYSALPYHINRNDGMVAFGISVVKTILYNLFVPCFIILALCIYSLVRRRWFTFFVTGGLIAHWFIVFVLAPASYFKYYFPIYIMGYFYLIATLIYLYTHRKDNEVSTPLI